MINVLLKSRVKAHRRVTGGKTVQVQAYDTRATSHTAQAKKRYPIKVGTEVIYKPDGATRARVGTVEKVNKGTYRIQSARRKDGSAPILTVPKRQVKSYAEHKAAAETKDTKYEASDRGTMARRQLKAVESRRRKAMVEKRLDRTEEQIFSLPKMIGYSKVKVDQFIQNTSGITHHDWPQVYAEFTVGMMQVLRREVPKATEQWIRDFKDHMDGKADTSDLWRLAGHGGRQAMINFSKQQRAREATEMTFDHQDAEAPLSEGLSSEVGQFLRNKIGSAHRQEATQGETPGPAEQEAVKDLVSGFLANLPKAHSDVLRRRFGIAPHKESQSFDEIAQAFVLAKRGKYGGKHAWNRNTAALAYKDAMRALVEAPNIGQLKPFAKSVPLLEAVFAPRTGRLRAALAGLRACFEPLIKSRSRVLACDFDGVVADFTDGFQGEDVFGEPIDGAAESLQALKNAGWTILIHTARTITPALKDYLQQHGIPYDSLEAKPRADIYLDDRGSRFVSWGYFMDEAQGLQKGGAAEVGLIGPLAAQFPGATIHAGLSWGTCIEADEALVKSWSKDLGKKYPSGRWITIKEGPMAGRHVFIQPHADKTATVIAGVVLQDHDTHKVDSFGGSIDIDHRSHKKVGGSEAGPDRESARVQKPRARALRMPQRYAEARGKAGRMGRSGPEIDHAASVGGAAVRSGESARDKGGLRKSLAAGYLLRKAKVKAHIRRTKGGAVVRVREHQDKRGASSAGGRRWNSPKGERRVVGEIHGRLEIALPGKGKGALGNVLLHPEELESEIHRDEANVASRAKQDAAAKAAAEAKAAADDTRGFYDRMTTLAAGKAKAALEKPAQWSKVFRRRKEHVEERVKAGWKVTVAGNGQRRFSGPDGQFLAEKDITKTAMDYAAYLLTSPENTKLRKSRRILVL